jgi:hypothetical protein
VLVNGDPAHAGVLALRVPQAGGGTATVWRLRAPSLAAASGVTLAGQSFDSTGILTGRLQADRVVPAVGRYVVSVPAASAALVTFGGNTARQAG